MNSKLVAATVGAVAGVLVLLTAIGVYADVAPGSPSESAAAPSSEEVGAPSGEAVNVLEEEAADVAAAPDAVAPDADPPLAETEPAEVAGSTASTAVELDPAAECERRLAANESVFIDALETGEGAAFYCTTSCKEPAADLHDPHPKSVPALQEEVEQFVDKAASIGNEAAARICLTRSGYEEPEAAQPGAGDDTLIPTNSALRENGDEGGSVAGGRPRDDGFIPADLFERADFPRV